MRGIYNVSMIFNEFPTDFEWDKGNVEKNYIKHRVLHSEGEEVFSDENKILLKTSSKKYQEKREILIGKTKDKRLLFIVFTIRNKKIRVISARDAHKKERRIYEKRIKITQV